MHITSIKAIEILDSRGKPTIRTFITLDDGSVHNASVPSGSSTGAYEALEMRDGDSSRYLGQGVLKAIANVNDVIAPKLKGSNIDDPKNLDRLMLELDGTENKSKLGANAILSVSMSAVRAASHTKKIPLWKYINKYYFDKSQASSYKLQPKFPRLMVNVVNGGKHAEWNFDIQEFMIIPKTNIPTKSLKIASEIFQQLGKELKSRKLSTLVGDEGGYSPALSSNEEVFEIIEASALKLGYKRNQDFEFAVDCAATEFFADGKYHFKKTNENKTSDQLMEYYSQIGQKYNIQSFEDPFAEDDWNTYAKFTKMAQEFKFQVVGDDLYVTNPKRIQKGIEIQASNSVLIKLNQIGSVSEAIEAIQMTQKAGWTVAVSHRSGDTEDPFIADLAYGVGADFIKTGSVSRSERLAKYNELLRIEERLGKKAKFAGCSILRKAKVKGVKV